MLANKPGGFIGVAVAVILGGLLWNGQALTQSAWEDDWGYWTGHRESQRLNREDAVAKYNYCPTGGCVVRLESVDVKPMRVKKGGTLSLATTYTILTPEQVAIPITITREILFKGQSIGKTRSMDTRQYNGTFVQEIQFTLPATAQAGDYALITRVGTGYGSEQKTVEFYVE